MYELKLPSVLKNMCIAYLVFGIIFSSTMMIASRSTDTVTRGHFYIGFTLIAIGIIGLVLCRNWKMTVTPNTIAHTNIFGITKEYSKDDIEKVSIGSKKELIIRFSKGKVTVDRAVTNYSRLVEELHK